ncbi:MAG: glycosyltransferase family 4 protein [Nanoarchaeota archaeon]|nr:glycosyltransferase family 4 protein [Nanoarchaeota archaeon]
MKNGILPFIYSELCMLEKNNIKFKIFATKYKTNGLCKVKKYWELYRFNPFRTLLKQPLVFLKNPIKYSSLFLESLRTRSLIAFLVACDYITNMDDIDRIHCHFGDTKLFIGYYCKKFTGKKLTVTIHAHELYQKNKKMFKRALEYCDKIISISDFNKKYLIDKYSIDPKKIVANRLFVDLEDFKKRKNISFLIVAQWHPKKGHKYLFRALKELNRDDVECWVVGGNVKGYAEVNVEKLADDIGVKDKVVFFGEQNGNALRAIYNKCDIFVLPSVTAGDKEGIPVVLMEAMAFEKPVISTFHAGIPEIVSDEFLVKEKDVKGLASKMREIINLKDKWQMIGKKNREIVLNKFSKKNLANLVRIFKG